ncbi:hypothetical protein [Candidatus Palauibacter sp.]
MQSKEQLFTADGGVLVGKFDDPCGILHALVIRAKRPQRYDR